jgi:hypothetical protein
MLESVLKAGSHLKVWAEIIGIGAATVGGYSAYEQYKASIETTKVEKTFEFRKQFESESIAVAWKKIDDRWAKFTDEYEPAGASPEAWTELTQKVVVGGQLQSEVFLVINFFEALEVCVANNICHEKASLDFFGRKSEKFYGAHAPFIIRIQKERKDSTFSEKLNNFVFRYRSYKSSK